ncbi:FTR1 family iron permease [Shimazuella sp. AN120528]|uniref:FTR1 family iron permease n=1 Tax=Shimazuella soli TaxID=1892854 RepID=UPI001F107E5E|nr:FTR1 family protein [Shimazuella soli]MCH5584389.1 FTR1 family iron permease [Shimazuella soli]
MLRKVLSFSLLLSVAFLCLMPMSTWANGQASEDMKKTETNVLQALQEARKGKLAESKITYQKFDQSWREIEDGVKEESAKAYQDIESHMGKVIYAFTIQNQKEIVKALEGLKSTNEKFILGKYPKGEVQKSSVSLPDFIEYLKQTKEKAQNHSQKDSLASISKVTESWLSVEGTVVAQSAQVYSDSERDMVTVQAMLAKNPPDFQGAVHLLDQMINYLSPLATKSGYTIWDAAMIIIREGLEALLVVTALLAYVKKSNQSKGKGWIWTGVTTGVIISIIIAVIVKMVFSSGAFGNNNALIAGWTGVIAAAMLLYVSYWLHSHSHITEWQNFIRSKSETALHTGKLISLGVISFLAVFREGTETVLFFIGMVNQISLQDLLMGLLIGFGILFLLAYLMIFIGLKLPIKPFFMISSIIVFYLCIKFTGMGIHSLQLAGVLPSTTFSSLPSVEMFALYPSLESILPQVVLVLIALLVVLWKRSTIKNQKLQDDGKKGEMI